MMEAIHSLLQQLSRMQWSDYLDIAVVAFLIYKLLPLLRAPGTVRIARAVVCWRWPVWRRFCGCIP